MHEAPQIQNLRRVDVCKFNYASTKITFMVQTFNSQVTEGQSNDGTIAHT